MQTGYFNAAWQDIKNSPGWVGKLLLLSLLLFIPVFGYIVMMGYLLGWARDMAWGVHAPLPQRIFGNEDGKLYSRGFFAWVISMALGVVLALATFLLTCLMSFVLGLGFVGAVGHHAGIAMVGVAAALLSVLSIILPIAASLAGALFQWVGWMRMSVYARLSAGFQFGKIWAMIRHDFGGIARILGMGVLILLVGGIAIVLLGLVVLLIVFALAAFSVGMGAVAEAPSWAVWAVLLALVALLAFAYAGMVLSVFTQMMTLRALGYWTRGFEVPLWRGQDDPLPFQMRAAGAQGR